jgi:membrane protease YdiL (CAAX protease family)
VHQVTSLGGLGERGLGDVSPSTRGRHHCLLVFLGCGAVQVLIGVLDFWFVGTRPAGRRLLGASFVVGEYSQVLVLSLLLAAVAPGTLTFAVTTFVALPEHRRVLAHAAVTGLLVLAHVTFFGPPEFRTPSILELVLAVGAGGLYNWCERWRVSRSRDTVMVFAAQSPAVDFRTAAGATALMVIGAAEELLFRWYLLTVPVDFGLLDPAAAAVVSILAFMVLHHDAGLGTMLSRGVFGLFLTLIVTLTGSLVAVMIIHAVYNVLILVRPVRYLVARKG